jgi:hypothetical protein
MVALLVHLARQLGDLLLLQGQGQRVQVGNALVGAAALGVLADPVGELRRLAQRAVRQHLGQRHFGVAAKVQRGGHQVQRADLGRAHGSTSPAARSMRQVRISGRPIRAVGSSLSMASSRLMPRPSLLALPAQS